MEKVRLHTWQQEIKLSLLYHSQPGNTLFPQFLPKRWHLHPDQYHFKLHHILLPLLTFFLEFTIKNEMSRGQDNGSKTFATLTDHPRLVDCSILPHSYSISLFSSLFIQKIKKSSFKLEVTGEGRNYTHGISKHATFQPNAHRGHHAWPTVSSHWFVAWTSKVPSSFPTPVQIAA